MATPTPDGALAVTLAVLVALLIGNYLYAVSGSGPATAQAAIGVISNGGRLLLGIAVMAGGTWFHLGLGVGIIAFSWFSLRSSSSNLTNASRSVRAMLNG